MIRAIILILVLAVMAGGSLGLMLGTQAKLVSIAARNSVTPALEALLIAAAKDTGWANWDSSAGYPLPNPLTPADFKLRINGVIPPGAENYFFCTRHVANAGSPSIDGAYSQLATTRKVNDTGSDFALADEPYAVLVAPGKDGKLAAMSGAISSNSDRCAAYFSSVGVHPDQAGSAFQVSLDYHMLQSMTMGDDVVAVVTLGQVLTKGADVAAGRVRGDMGTVPSLAALQGWTATGAFSALAYGKILTPATGVSAFTSDDQTAYIWNGAAWTRASGGTPPVTPTLCGDYVFIPDTVMPDGGIVPAFCVNPLVASKAVFAIFDGSGITYNSQGDRSGAWKDFDNTRDGGTNKLQTFVEAKASCQARNGRLISNAQWMAIAYRIAKTASNWSGGVVGSGSLARGEYTSGDRTSPSQDVNLGDCASYPHAYCFRVAPSTWLYHFAGGAPQWVDATEYKDWRTDFFTATESDVAAPTFDSRPAYYGNEFACVPYKEGFPGVAFPRTETCKAPIKGLLPDLAFIGINPASIGSAADLAALGLGGVRVSRITGTAACTNLPGAAAVTRTHPNPIALVRGGGGATDCAGTDQLAGVFALDVTYDGSSAGTQEAAARCVRAPY